MSDIPTVRSHERIDYKRCPKKWFWKWRRGLVPRATSFGALELGTWVHEALARWYAPGGSERAGNLPDRFMEVSSKDLRTLVFQNNQEADRAVELQDLGRAMTGAYQEFYGIDYSIDVISPEIPLEFTFSANDTNEAIAVHKFKPDLVYRDRATGYVWLMEHKTAATIRTEHLVIDDQARPYGAMAERGLRNAGIIDRRDIYKGVMYNFLRKAFPDKRDINEQGQALNRDGTVSKRQPAPLFRRHPVHLTVKAKKTSLYRLRTEVFLLAYLTQELRRGNILPRTLPKTPHYSCPKTCQFFTMCVAEEGGADIREMEKSMYTRRNPYDYDKETTEDTISFEMG